MYTSRARTHTHTHRHSRHVRILRDIHVMHTRSKLTRGLRILELPETRSEPPLCRLFVRKVGGYSADKTLIAGDRVSVSRQCARGFTTTQLDRSTITRELPTSFRPIPIDPSPTSRKIP